MPKISGRDKGGQDVWQFSDGTIVPLAVIMDSDGNAIDIETGIVLAAGSNLIGKITISHDGNDMTVNSDGHGDILPHAHPDEGTIHFHVDNLGVSTNYILIDLSDTTNYPHENIDYIHIDNIYLEVDASAAADYIIKIGFLKNVDASNGDRYTAFHVSGTKQTGQNKEMFLPLLPAGIRMRSSSLATHDVSVDDNNYQTDVNMKTTLDPSTANTPSGNGDVVCEVIINAGQITLAINLSYHSHQ